MGKALVVGDMHLKQSIVLPRVDALARRFGVRRIVFTGDYCDERRSSDALLSNELGLFADWVGGARHAGMQIDLLLGNHDYQYVLGRKGSGTHVNLLDEVRALLEGLGPQIAATVDGILVTHAGLTEPWMREYLGDVADAAEAACQLNALHRGSEEDRYALLSCGPGRGGRDLPGPLWADRDELRREAAPGIDQIVGHTPSSTCELVCADAGAAHDVRIWTCDTFSLTLRHFRFPIGDGSMLLVEDGQVSVVGENDGEFLAPWGFVVFDWERHAARR